MTSPYGAGIAVGWHTHSTGAETARNTPTDVYTPDLDSVGEQRWAIGLAPVSTSEPNESRVVVRYQLLVPPNFTSAPKDVVDTPLGRFEVDGDVEDYNYGPFGFAPGSAINLKRYQR